MANLCDIFASLWKQLEMREGELENLPPPQPKFVVDVRSRLSAIEANDSIRKNIDELLTLAGGNLSHTLELAMQIDESFERFRDFSMDEISDKCYEYMNFLTKKGRLNESIDLGQVVLRYPLYGSRKSEVIPAETLASRFDNLVLLPTELHSTDPDDRDLGCRIDFRYVMLTALEDMRSLLEEGDHPNDLKVGFAPLAQHESELRIESAMFEDGRPGYDVHVHGPAVAPERIDAIVANLCREGCRIIALPEMVLDDSSLELLKAALRRYGPQSNLVLVLAGTRREAVDGGGPPRNCAVVLDHVGEPLFSAPFTQSKLARWNLTEQQRHEYDIPIHHDGDLLHEYITPGETMVIVEQPGVGRIVVLVCEDLGRAEPGAWVRKNMVIEVQFVPIMDGDILQARWNYRDACVSADEGRCHVIVANSLPLALRRSRKLEKRRNGEGTHRTIGLAVTRTASERPGDEPILNVRTARVMVPHGGTGAATHLSTVAS